MPLRAPEPSADFISWCERYSRRGKTRFSFLDRLFAALRPRKKGHRFARCARSGDGTAGGGGLGWVPPTRGYYTHFSNLRNKGYFIHNVCKMNGRELGRPICLGLHTTDITVYELPVTPLLRGGWGYHEVAAKRTGTRRIAGPGERSSRSECKTCIGLSPGCPIYLSLPTTVITVYQLPVTPLLRGGWGYHEVAAKQTGTRRIAGPGERSPRSECKTCTGSSLINWTA